MERREFDYYIVLAERVLQRGLRSEEIMTVARYRSGKTYRDMSEAFERLELEVSGKGRIDRQQIRSTAIRLSMALKIDTSNETLDEYRAKLDRL